MVSILSNTTRLGDDDDALENNDDNDSSTNFMGFPNILISSDDDSSSSISITTKSTTIDTLNINIKGRVTNTITDNIIEESSLATGMGASNKEA